MENCKQSNRSEDDTELQYNQDSSQECIITTEPAESEEETDNRTNDVAHHGEYSTDVRSAKDIVEEEQQQIKRKRYGQEECESSEESGGDTELHDMVEKIFGTTSTP
ncbi:unnamed protein product [Arctia plantaginis]|uniref:Uncharacterized protein n=1 Tax=Arctia plantaginis TaxID=874455 RepID=A0A8S1BM00_ARCPL|nr:unnamed protein product [Arctia plantaginis]